MTDRRIWIGVATALAAGLTAWIPNVSGWIDSAAALNHAQASALLAARSQVDVQDQFDELRAECVTTEKMQELLVEFGEWQEHVEAELKRRRRAYTPAVSTLVLPDPPAPAVKKKPRDERVQEVLEKAGFPAESY